MNEFSKNVADSMLLLGIMAGVVTVGKVVVNDLVSPKSAIIIIFIEETLSLYR